jgi:protocatechuate 3,4-dioxygenase beta subunit
MHRSFFNWSRMSRRGFLFAAAAAHSIKAQGSAPSCVLISEQEEGPYYIEGAALRGNITEGKAGVPLALQATLVDAKRCAPLVNAAVEIWHCDAGGIYSGFTAEGSGGFGGPPGPRSGRGRALSPPPPEDAQGVSPAPFFGGRGRRQIDGTRFLRGVQITNQQGIVEFVTIYPGWYQGRTIHIHLKVHTGGEGASETYPGGHVCHTGQLFFPEEVTEKISVLDPYIRRRGVRRTTLEEDHVFRSQNGSSSIMHLERVAAADGLVATVNVAVDPDRIPSQRFPA